MNGEGAPGLAPRTKYHASHGMTVDKHDGTIVELTAPFMLWLPRLTLGEFRLPAGSNGVAASIAENFILRTVGESAVAAHLRPLLSRTTVAPHDKIAANLAEIEIAFAALVRIPRATAGGFREDGPPSRLFAAASLAGLGRRPDGQRYWDNNGAALQTTHRASLSG